MINEIRSLLAALIFCVGAYLVWDLYTAGFDMVVFIFCVGCFISAHFIIPDIRSHSDSSSFWDILDFIADIPFKTISVFLRALGRAFNNERGQMNGEMNGVNERGQ